MSDDFDDDDAFMVDDSFLAEVDSIAAKASSSAPPGGTGGYKNALPLSTTTGGPAGFASARTALSKANTVGAITSSGAGAFNRANAIAGPSRVTRPAPAAHPPSDDFDEFDLPTESLDLIDTISAAPPTSRPPSLPLSSSSASSKPVPLPSSRLGMGSGPGRALGRSSSGSDGLQTHLNFRRENQSTKGKRWDRTAFAESGRRVDAAKIKAQKGKGKGKGRRFDDGDDDEVMSDEDDWGEPLAPPPKPLVDISKPYGPQKHALDPETRTTYIYPTNRSKREYQYEIVRGCFTDNCLVALPTGLGKTFVAGVVMLNFYRWFPTGKIVFLAPTKPLVNQQIEACQLACGIPSADAAVMTGSSVSQKERAKLWAERRVFYCTPQTLDNDLKKGSVDPRDIVLAVFDEAHKASGSYAYTTILAYITAHHPFFRVLALTATPGADVPRVQAVVDALHISRIEIREAEAPEIRKYMNEKRTEKHTVAMGHIIEGFRDRWAALMKPYVVKLVDKQVLTERDLDIKRLRPFRLTAKRMEIARDRSNSQRWAYGPLNQIERMARAMGHLLEFSLGMFRTALLEIDGGKDAKGNKAGTKTGASAIHSNFEFQKLLRDVETEMSLIRIGKDGRSKADRHPKMVKTLQLLLDHFQLADEDEKQHGVKNDTRAMIFCSFRDCVLEVVDMLNEHPELLRATKFVGQSQGKQEEDKGFNQKEQKKTIQEFKEGKHNILVSTSIGEEGLDIGEVDFVVIYDMPKQSIKLLQRIGRTGRKRDGKVHVLMSEGREDMNWDTAQQTHREIQEEILHSRNLELFEDVEPLLPLGKFPKCVEQEMPVDPWDPADQKLKRRLPGSQRPGPGEEREPPAKKQRGAEIPREAHQGFVSVADLIKQNKKIKADAKKRAKTKTPTPEPSDDEDEDAEAAHELLYGSTTTAKGKRKATAKKKAPAAPKAQPKAKGKAKQPKETKAEREHRVEKDALNKRAIDFFNTCGPTRRRMTTPPLTPPSSPPVPLPSPPRRKTATSSHLPPSPITDESLERGGIYGHDDHAKASIEGLSQLDPMDLDWDNDSVENSDDIRPITRAPQPPPLAHSRSAIMMPPPPVPLRISSPAHASPFSIRPGPAAPGRHAVNSVSPAEAPARPSTPAVEDSSPLIPQRQRQRPRQRAQQRTARPDAKSKRKQDTNLLDLDVEVSGSSQSADESSGEESESDRLFAGEDFQPTQAPRGYDQRAMYAAGLSTQAGPRSGLNFRSAQTANARKEAFFAKARRPVLLSDSEGEQHESDENEYELGSFVCDDASVDFDTQTHSDPLSCS